MGKRDNPLRIGNDSARILTAAGHNATAQDAGGHIPLRTSAQTMFSTHSPIA